MILSGININNFFTILHAREIFDWHSYRRGQPFQIAPAFTAHAEIRASCTCRIEFARFEWRTYIYIRHWLLQTVEVVKRVTIWLF